MDIFKQFKRNDDTIVNGAKLILDAKGEAFILVARMHQSNPQFKKAGQKMMQQNQRQLDAITDDAERQELLASLSEMAAADVCITGWEGLEVDGQPFVYSKENAHRIRTELPELFEQIVQFATTSSNYVGTFDEDESLKNSPTASLSA